MLYIILSVIFSIVSYVQHFHCNKICSKPCFFSLTLPLKRTLNNQRNLLITGFAIIILWLDQRERISFQVQAGNKFLLARFFTKEWAASKALYHRQMVGFNYFCDWPQGLEHHLPLHLNSRGISFSTVCWLMLPLERTKTSRIAPFLLVITSLFYLDVKDFWWYHLKLHPFLLCKYQHVCCCVKRQCKEEICRPHPSSYVLWSPWCRCLVYLSVLGCSTAWKVWGFCQA